MNTHDNGYETLAAYQKSFQLAMAIFEISKSFPKEERYSLTDQIRRSSRSVCANIGEGYRKRRYPKHFLSKMSDADGEMTETQIWIKFALKCGYITMQEANSLLDTADQSGKLIGYMISHPERFALK